jgi:hypothetical protein
MEGKKRQVILDLESDEYALLQLVAKHYGNGIADCDRDASDMATIIVRNSLKRIIAEMQKV